MVFYINTFNTFSTAQISLKCCFKIRNKLNIQNIFTITGRKELHKSTVNTSFLLCTTNIALKTLEGGLNDLIKYLTSKLYNISIMLQNFT